MYVCCIAFPPIGNKPPTIVPSAPYLSLFLNIATAFFLPDKPDVSVGLAKSNKVPSSLWSGDATKSVTPTTVAPPAARCAILEALLVPILAVALTIGAALVARCKILATNPPGAPNCVINFAMSPLQVSGLSGSISFANFWNLELKSLSVKRSVPINKSSPRLVDNACLPDSIPFAISENPSM